MTLLGLLDNLGNLYTMLSKVNAAFYALAAPNVEGETPPRGDNRADSHPSGTEQPTPLSVCHADRALFELFPFILVAFF